MDNEFAKKEDIDEKLKIDDDEVLEIDGLQNLKKAKWIINPDSAIKKYWDLVNVFIAVKQLL